jgi:8-hydroxy-5-deazaflavin:NADPH oxidoreductase
LSADHEIAELGAQLKERGRSKISEESMKIAVLGAGNVGKALGKALAARGHDIVYGVRDPKRSEAKPAKTVSDAIQGSEAVILATPYDATSALLRGNATALAGKVVIDATNPLKPDLSGLSLTADVSGAELLQREAPSALLFKAFNTTGYGNMQNPDYPQGRAVMFVAGPDGKGKQTVMQLVTEVGFDAVDAGDLTQARLLEPLAMLWIKLAFAEGLGVDCAFVLARRNSREPKS